MLRTVPPRCAFEMSLSLVSAERREITVDYMVSPNPALRQLPCTSPWPDTMVVVLTVSKKALDIHLKVDNSYMILDGKTYYTSHVRQNSVHITGYRRR